jgi:tungstate transport system permease protein
MRRNKMIEYIKQAFSLLLGGDRELWQIIGVTIRMSLLSTLISCLIGLPLGVAAGRANFRGKGLFIRVTNTLMGLPPVVAGLVVFMLLSRSGPFGSLKLLFSVTAMVIAQVILITPIITGLSASVSSARAGRLKETATGLGIGRFRQVLLLLSECRVQLISVALTGFGRAISEVGAVQLVGGNIQYKTRVMTTAIMLETNKGNFEFAVALGIILLLLAFIFNSVAYIMQEKFNDRSQ